MILPHVILLMFWFAATSRRDYGHLRYVLPRNIRLNLCIGFYLLLLTFLYELRPEFYLVKNLSITIVLIRNSLCKKCLYSELLWSALSRIRTEYGDSGLARLLYVKILQDSRAKWSTLRHAE